MTEEEKLVRENAQIIRYCALDFMRERHMPYTLYYDDVFQEAAIGFIKWHRKLESGAYHYMTDAHKYIRTSIRYHLYKHFIHQRGIHRNPKKECNIMVEEMPDDNFGEIGATPYNVEDDMVFAMDVARWVSTLTPNDRLAVQMMLRGYKPGDIESHLNTKPSQYQWQKRRIGKSYRAYFGEAG